MTDPVLPGLFTVEVTQMPQNVATLAQEPRSEDAARVSRYARPEASRADPARRGEYLAKLRAAWAVPRTMHEAAEIVGVPVSSICSLKDAIGDEVEHVGWQVKTWARRSPTQRKTWRMKS